VEERTIRLSFALQGVSGSSSALPFNDFLWIFGKNVLVLQDRILGNTEI